MTFHRKRTSLAQSRRSATGGHCARAAPPPPPQPAPVEQPVTFQSKVNLVLVPVVVRDLTGTRSPTCAKSLHAIRQRPAQGNRELRGGEGGPTRGRGETGSGCEWPERGQPRGDGRQRADGRPDTLSRIFSTTWPSPGSKIWTGCAMAPSGTSMSCSLASVPPSSRRPAGPRSTLRTTVRSCGRPCRRFSFKPWVPLQPAIG